MAVKRKPEAVSPGAATRARRDVNIQERAEDTSSAESLRTAILAGEAPPKLTEGGVTHEEPEGDIDTTRSDATPVGGKADELKPPQPPVAQITPPPSKSIEIETDEQIDARLNDFQAKTKEQEKALPVLKSQIKDKNALARKFADDLKAAEAKIKELEGKIVPEEEMTRLRDADKHFQLRAVEQLPRWKEYDAQIQKIGGDANEMLKGFGISEAVLKVISEKRGGVISFMSSDKPAGKEYKNADNSPMTEAEWFQKYVFGKLNELQKSQFGALTTGAIAKQREKEEALTAAKTDAAKTLQDEQKKFWDSFNAEADATLKEVLPELLPKLDLPTQLPVLSGTESPEEKAKKEKDIADWQKADKAVIDYAKVITAKDRVNVAVKAALFDVFIDGRWPEFQAQLKEWKTKAEDLQKFKDGIKDARRLNKTASPAPSHAIEKPEMTLSTEEALQRAGFKTA